MSKKMKKVPQLRFPGFCGEWEERKLGDVYTQRNERGFDTLQILSVSIHHGVSNEELDSDTLGKKVRRSEDKSLYKHVYDGDLVLNMMRAWQGAIGVVHTEGMVSPAYITAFPSAQLYPPFMEYYLRRDETIGQIDNLSYGVTDFRKRLYWNSFIDVSCCIPSVPEQEKITAFFKQLDHLIALQQRKLTHLQARKKGLLQKMLPKDGELFPELRFTGFTDDWKERKLGDITNSFSGGTPSVGKSSYYNGEIPFIRSAEINSKSTELFISQEGLNSSSAKIVNVGDILYALYGATSGEVGIAQIEGAINQAILAIQPKENYDSQFIMQWLGGQKQRIIDRFLQGGQGNLSGSIVKDLLIEFPNYQEQQKIGAFFKQLDDSITLHQRKLDHLQDRKKALLQQMFV